MVLKGMWSRWSPVVSWSSGPLIMLTRMWISSDQEIQMGQFQLAAYQPPRTQFEEEETADMEGVPK